MVAVDEREDLRAYGGAELIGVKGKKSGQCSEVFPIRRF